MAAHTFLDILIRRTALFEEDPWFSTVEPENRVAVNYRGGPHSGCLRSGAGRHQEAKRRIMDSVEVPDRVSADLIAFILHDRDCASFPVRRLT